MTSLRAIDRRRLLWQPFALALFAPSVRAWAQAPGATLRAVWLAGNPVQARPDAAGEPQGPAIDVAQAFAKRNGARLELSSAANPAAVLDRVRQGAADIGFVAFDPTRADGLLFSPPYLLSLNRFAVRPGAAIASQDQVDRPGVRVGAILTDSGGLYLQRTLHNATLTGVPTAEEGVAALLAGKIDVMGTNGQRLADIQAAGAGLGILPGSFSDVPQVIAVRRDNLALAAQATALVKDLIASGAIAASVKRWNLTGAQAAKNAD